MAVLTIEAFLSKWEALFPTNGNREITASRMRDFRQDIADSFQAVAGGVTITSWKSPCAVATVGNITLSGEQTIDGVLTSASRVLVKNQTTTSQNGIYVSAAGAWARSTDADAAAELEGAAVGVTQGTTQQNTVWLQTSDNITLGSTAIAWQQIGFGGGTQTLSSVLTTGNDGGGLQIKNITDPTIAQDAATKNYVDNTLNSSLAGINWKQSVKAATTANITLSGAQTIDGISLVAADRCLVKNQSTASQNGIYVVASGAWTRSTDNDSTAEMQNAVVSVDQGTTNADTSWRQSADNVTVGSSSVTWVSFGSAGIGGSTGSTDNRVLRADGTGGSTLQNSAVSIDDSGNIILPTATFIGESGGTNLSYDYPNDRIIVLGNNNNYVEVFGLNNEIQLRTNNTEKLRISSTGIYNNGYGLKHSRVTTGSIAAASTALVTVTWTTAFADANYTVQASVLDSTTSSLSLSVVHVETISASQVQVRVINNAAGSLTGTLHVIAIHD